MHKKRSKSIPSILSLAVLVGSLVVQVQPSFGRPAMITHSAESPGVGAPAQKTRDIGVGDVSFESPTGSLNYNYNFVVPPGRLGMQPGIGLAYSSQGSLRGGVAAGWSLNVPMIQRDLSGLHGQNIKEAQDAMDRAQRVLLETPGGSPEKMR